jgi:hypothetical protein
MFHLRPDFKYINGFFEAFSEIPGVKLLCKDLEIVKKRKGFHVEYGEFTYRASVKTSTFTNKDNIQTHILEVKFSNHMFLTKLEAPIFYNPVHGCKIDSDCTSIWDFANMHFGSNQWFVRVYYDDHKECVDMKFKHKSKPHYMIITFEQEYPECLFEDGWEPRC